MGATDEAQFDPQFAVSLLLEIGRQTSLERILETLRNRILSRPHVARMRMWLLNKSDNCLHAVVEGANPLPGQWR